MSTPSEARREVRKKKILERSQGIRNVVHDLAMTSNPVTDGEIAILDEGVPTSDVPEIADEGKSEARLLAERRRQRILGRSSERMAKVQGDRRIVSASPPDVAIDVGQSSEMSGSTDEGMEPSEVSDSSFHKKNIAEEKPNSNPTAPLFKPGDRSAKEGKDVETAVGVPIAEVPVTSADVVAESKAPITPRPPGRPTGQTAGAGGGMRGGRKARAVSRGNQALNRQGFDAETVKALSGGGVNDESKEHAASNARHRQLGLLFWMRVEGGVKVLLLLMAGAAVGTLLLPSAVVVAARGGSAPIRDKGEEGWRLNLESYIQKMPSLEEDLAGEGEGLGSGFFEGGVLDDKPHEEEEEGVALEVDSMGGEKGWGGRLLQGSSRTLILFEEGLSWVHSGLSSVNRALPTTLTGWFPNACVPAMVLALLMRLLVGVLFLFVRRALRYPSFPPARKAKPGFVMGIILGAVPFLENVMKVSKTMVCLFSDTALVMVGTFIALAVGLNVQGGSAMRGTVLSMMASVMGEVHDGEEDSHGGEEGAMLQLETGSGDL